MQILIVDDELVSRRKLEKLVQSLGHEPIVAEDGLTAWQIWSDQRPRMVITDWLMPGMDGPTLCQKIRSAEGPQYTHITMVTAKNMTEDMVIGMEAGVDDFLTKPFNKWELVMRIKAGERVVNLLGKQEINIALSKSILNLVNSLSPRYTELPGDRLLFFDDITIPSNAEGGDHYFMRNLVNSHGQCRSMLTLKDQSGHEVGCILRSIASDLMHNAILHKNSSLSLTDVVSRLNWEICNSNFFRPDDFFTSVTVEIDHETLMLRFVSAGHPSFLLIRDTDIIPLPEPDRNGANPPVAMDDSIAFSLGEYQLKENDKLLFYTDGLTEMPIQKRNRVIRLEELKSIVTAILGKNENLPVSELMVAILDNIAAMSGEVVVPFSQNTSTDDITILGLEIEKNNYKLGEILRIEDRKDIDNKSEWLFKKMEPLLDQLEWQIYETRSLIYMPLVESVVNAWKHGNKEDPEKAVTVRWWLSNDFNIEVSDEGEGFDYHNIKNPTMSENLTQENGRGLFIIRKLADSVRWKNGGRSIHLSFRKRIYPRHTEQISQTIKLMDLWKRWDSPPRHFFRDQQKPGYNPS